MDLVVSLEVIWVVPAERGMECLVKLEKRDLRRRDPTYDLLYSLIVDVVEISGFLVAFYLLTLRWSFLDDVVMLAVKFKK